MSALFMGHHRYSSINPEDIARFGGRRPSLNGIAFRISSDEDEEDEEDEYSGEDTIGQHSIGPDDEEKAIGGFGEPSKFRRQVSSRQSTRSRASTRKHPILHRLYRKWKRIYVKYGLQHIIPILLLILYSLIGALIFQAIESPYAQQKQKIMAEKMENNRKSTAKAILTDLNIQENENINERLWTHLAQFEISTRKLLPIQETLNWDIWGSLFYCGTVYTTVGYGNIYPETTAGWICTIIYAFFGVPLLLAILSDIGSLLCVLMDRGWRAFVNRIPKCTRTSESESDSPSKCNGNDGLTESCTGEGSPQPGAPIVLALALTFAWLLLCSGLFCLWERKWTYFTAFYFFFISLSTIGLGDITPDQPMLMVLMAGFLIIGLCLVSMTIGVVQEHIELFLFRVMIALQKECEQLLGNGEDVERKQLLNRVWNRQPWLVRRFMPAVMGGTKSKRLNDFAGATITDTAVQMGLIPPPPTYHRSLVPMAPGPIPRSEHSPFVKFTKQNETIQSASGAGGSARSALLVDSGAAPGKALFPKVATVKPQQRPTSASAEFLPGGIAIVRRKKLGCDQKSPIRPKLTAVHMFVQTDLTGLDLMENKDRFSTISLASWCEDDALPSAKLVSSNIFTMFKESNEIGVQTELTGVETIIKMETLSNLSLASWSEDEQSPAPVTQMKTLTAPDDMVQFHQVAQQTPTVSADADRTRNETESGVQSKNEDRSESSTEFESALETRSFAFRSKSCQTTDQAERTEAETQTGPGSVKMVEVQTSIIPRMDAEIQHSMDSVDEEVQTVVTQISRDTTMEGNEFEDAVEHVQMEDDTASADNTGVVGDLEQASADSFTQTTFEGDFHHVEVQTVPLKTCSLEIQTEDSSVLSAETQTDRRKISFQVQADEESEEDEEKGEGGDEAVEGDHKMIWSYSAWFDKDGKKGLDSVAEVEDEYDTDEEDINGGDLYSDQKRGLLEELEEEESAGYSEGGQTMPAITVSPPSSASGSTASISDHFVTQKRDQSEGGFGSVSVEMGVQTNRVDTHSVACQTARTRHPSSTVITAAIATQTEDVMETGEWLTVPEGQAQAMFSRNRQGGSFRRKLSAWAGRRGVALNKRNIAAQTDGSIGDGVRDIIIQTDDSYLRMARRLNALRSTRARSLKIAVAPQLKRRVNQLANSASGVSESSSAVIRSRLGKI